MRYGCRGGLPHDMKILHETSKAKYEVCQICNKKFRFNKRLKGRVENKEYLKIHSRNFCQEFGKTKRLYNRIYHPERMVIKI